MAENRTISFLQFLNRLVFLVTCLILFVGCAGKETAVIKIGIAGPMTGDQSKMGMDFRNGVQLAVEEWNAKGGVLGKPVQMLVEDDQRDPKQAVSVANKLVKSGVAGVIGHFNSSCSIPASRVYAEAKIPMITPASTNPQLTDQGLPMVFRVCGRDDQQGKVAADFAVENLKARRIAVLHDKTTYGQGLADEFKRALAGRAEVVYYGSIIQGDRDFRAVLTTLKAKKPDLYFFGGIYPDAGLLARQAKELGLTAPMLSGDGTIDVKFLEIAGPAAEGTSLTFSPDPAKIPTAKAFLEAYHKKFGPHGPYSIYAYDATYVLLSAIQEAGTTDGRKVSEMIRARIHQGALGTIRFDAKGDVTQAPYVVWITKGGKFEELR
ncbi:MAG: branched-chain amino acid ABC transporter substrate-binding protein [Nitrospirae bacterium]|nr:branched-chain amino acid ABC transporter substrate-binding protein [Nitrospirota bacterium]